MIAVPRVVASVSPLLSRRTTASAIATAPCATAQILRSARLYSSYQPPNPPKQQQRQQASGVSSSTYADTQKAFYRDFGPPVLKVFLGALVTYQVLYWGWLKLESMETKEEKTAEIASLETQVRELAARKKNERQ